MDADDQALAKELRMIGKLALVVCLTAVAQAHVGSPDIYLDGKAGPYQLFITVRPPMVIPGVAALEVRCQSPGVREIRATPIPIAEGAQFAPVADKLTVSKEDPQFFAGSLWMMAPGSWQVRISVEGAQGEGVLAVPVPSAALTTKKMQRGLGALLLGLMTFLVLGVVAMAGASVREAKLEPGIAPTPDAKRRGRVAMSIAFTIVIAVVWLGGMWWDNEANSYANKVYKPLQMTAALNDRGVLTLTMSDPGWLRPRPGRINRALFVRKMDDLVPDHNHLMHLYAIRQPGLDVVYHLHPELVETGVFRLHLPGVAPGMYRLYADIVHANGFPETMVTSVRIPPDLEKRPLSGDDASGAAIAWNNASTAARVFTLPDGYRMEWLRGSEALHAKQPIFFRFRLNDPENRAPRDMAFYMGMLGHAAFVKTDGSVFAHIHPSGSVSMAAMMLLNQPAIDTPATKMAGMEMPEKTIPNEASFPYGFPSGGRYRIFVQMKHGETIETGIFDADVQ